MGDLEKELAAAREAPKLCSSSTYPERASAPSIMFTAFKMP